MVHRNDDDVLVVSTIAGGNISILKDLEKAKQSAHKAMRTPPAAHLLYDDDDDDDDGVIVDVSIDDHSQLKDIITVTDSDSDEYLLVMDSSKLNTKMKSQEQWGIGRVVDRPLVGNDRLSTGDQDQVGAEISTADDEYWSFFQSTIRNYANEKLQKLTRGDLTDDSDEDLLAFWEGKLQGESQPLRGPSESVPIETRDASDKQVYRNSPKDTNGCDKLVIVSSSDETLLTASDTSTMDGSLEDGYAIIDRSPTKDRPSVSAKSKPQNTLVETNLEGIEAAWKDTSKRIEQAMASDDVQDNLRVPRLRLLQRQQEMLLTEGKKENADIIMAFTVAVEAMMSFSKGRP